MKTHREQFTAYLRTAPRWGNERQDWREWLDDHDICRCESCGRYGSRGDDVSCDVAGNDTCTDCEFEAIAEYAGFTVAYNGEIVTLSVPDAIEISFCDNLTHTAKERATVYALSLLERRWRDSNRTASEYARSQIDSINNNALLRARIAARRNPNPPMSKDAWERFRARTS